ncbi:MAG: glyoxalase [Lachnospiraceae bacterium]
MFEFDEIVLQCFLKNQEQLFTKIAMHSLEEVDEFLSECMAVVVDSVEEVNEYFEEEGVDMDGLSGNAVLEASEVFTVGDGRYLIVLA